MVRDSKAHYRGLQWRAAIRSGGVTILVSLHTLGRVEVVDKHQWLTVVYALLTVEAGERYDGLAKCDRVRRRHSAMDTGASPHRHRAPWPK